MNKKELITAIAEKSNLTMAQASVALSKTFDVLKTALIQHDTIQIADLVVLQRKSVLKEMAVILTLENLFLFPQLSFPCLSQQTN